MKPFRELSRRGRLYRLRKLAITALEAYKLEGARLRFIQYGENIIYRVDVPDSPHSKAIPHLILLIGTYFASMPWMTPNPLPQN